MFRLLALATPGLPKNALVEVECVCSISPSLRFVSPSSADLKSAAVVHERSGHVFVSSVSAGEGKSATEDAESALAALQAALAAAGSSLDRVLKCTVFLTAMDDYVALNEAYGKVFSGPSKPARTCFAAAGLPANARLAIECIAATSTASGPVQTARVAAADAPSPGAVPYSHAQLLSAGDRGERRTLYVSGCIPLNAEHKMEGANAAEQVGGPAG